MCEQVLRFSDLFRTYPTEDFKFTAEGTQSLNDGQDSFFRCDVEWCFIQLQHDIIVINPKKRVVGLIAQLYLKQHSNGSKYLDILFFI